MKSYHVRAISVLALISSAVAAGCSAGDSSSDLGPSANSDLGNTAQKISRGPRLFLTSTVLARLKARAAANDAGWTALRSHCDKLATGTVNKPTGNAYPGFPNVGQGYQGDGYLPEIMNIGLCYRVVEGDDATREATYAAAGARILTAMSTPAGSGGQPPSTDSGYGMRNYGVGMAFGFDWLYPSLSASVKSQVISTINAWIDWYDVSGFIKDDPIGNYFEGYLLGKAAGALATEGDNSKATTYWSDVETRMWGKLVKPSFTQWMEGGGWPEGWQYGPRSVQNVVQFLWAAKTAKGLTWWDDLPQARDQAKYIQHFAWPSLKHMDDQGTVHAQDALTPSAATVMAMAMMLEYNGDLYASTARSFGDEVAKVTGTTGDDWQNFLYYDATLPRTDYKLQPLSYFAKGPSHVAARSSWAKDATWGTLVAGQYIDADYSGEQYFNQGSVAIVQGDQPILVNPTGWLPQAAGDQGEAFVYEDTWGSRTRKLNNTFFVSGSTQDSKAPTTNSCRVEHYEDGVSYVRARGVDIEAMYSKNAVTQFTRDFVYVRPNTFVIYDRTTIANASSDQWLSWHTPTNPVLATTADASQRRYDVKNGSAIVGSIRTLLPKNPKLSTTNLLSGAAYRLEEHSPSSTAAQDWLTVVTTGGTVPEQVRLSSADGNVSAGDLVGVHVQGARNAVVLFDSDHAAVGTNSVATYQVRQTADADHVLVDVAPSATGYSITTSLAGGVITVTVKAGGTFKPTANGTLAFVVSTTGAVTEAPKPSNPGGGTAGSYAVPPMAISRDLSGFFKK